jgi:hypothetical protein
LEGVCVKTSLRALALIVGLIPVLLLSSCGIIQSDCSRMKSNVASKEAWGQILFGEYELQRNRFLEIDNTKSRLSESTVDLLENYIEVQELLLENPKCLSDPTLESVLRNGISTIQSKVKRAGLGNANAFAEMQGEIDKSYQSFELWIKN